MAPPRTAESQVAALARSAVSRGHAALTAGARDEALRWLDRAHRLVPADLNVMLLLASACLEQDPVRSVGLFRRVAEQHDVRHAWLGLAAAETRAGGDPAAALFMALSRHAFSPDGARLADQIAGSAGWCGLASDGTIWIGPNAGDVVLRLDGKPIRGVRLPVGWRAHRRLDVQIDGRTPVGSPIDIGRIRRVVGYVEAWDGGLRGWAWHPGDPDTPATLSIDGIGAVSALTESADIPETGPLARPRVFSVARDALRGKPGQIHVRGPDGRDILGSPLDPSLDAAEGIEAEPAVERRSPAGSATAAGGRAPTPADAAQPGRAIGADRRKRDVTVVIPVHNGTEATNACLAGVLAAADTSVVVVDDGSTDDDLIATLDRLARTRAIKLLRHKVPLGFPASANAGIRAAAGRDVVLLNSDTLVPNGWLRRLRQAAYSAPDIGTVTPLSNEASILSYPGNAGRNPPPDQAATERMNRLARRANGDVVVDIPVGVGFCLYLRRDCLNATGLLRDDIFAQGYGEENDFCLRARHLGWRHVALPGLFVGHRGGASFDPSASHLRARNARILERLHSGHDALIQRFIAADPLADARRRLDRERFRAALRDGRPATILITHTQGGGVEQRIAESVRSLEAAGRRALVLRPSGDGGVAVHDGLSDAFPNLVYALPRELPAVRRLLRTARSDSIQVHHLLDHAPAIHDLVAVLAVPYDVHIHDYAWFCPRLSLVGRHDRYCGEPELRACEACVADLGHFLSEDISVAALRARSAGFLAAARTVVAPSQDTARRMQRHFPGLAPAVVPHEDDLAIPAPPRPAPRRGRWRVCVIGGIGVHKGYDVLLACARDAARRNLDLEFVVVGGTIDDARLLATERVFVTGGFEPQDAVPLLKAQGASLGFVASIWPETWCLTLGELWRAGLSAAAFDIGAPAERIRRTGSGFLLPLGLPAGAINTALVVAAETGYCG